MKSSVLQPFWEKCFHISKIGMNYWGGCDIYSSGEINVIKYICKQIPQNSCIVFDVGANVGEYSKIVYSIFTGANIECTIHAFEPSKRTFNILVQKIIEQKTKSINPYNFGFSSSEQKTNLYSNSAVSPIATLHKLTGGNLEYTEEYTEEIQLTTIDKFALKNKINIIDLLKIDVEGHEFDVLTGAKKMINDRKIRYIQFEFGESNIESKVFFRNFYDLLNPNYTIYRILPSGLRKITKYSEDNEVFSTSNFLAELK